MGDLQLLLDTDVDFKHKCISHGIVATGGPAIEIFALPRKLYLPSAKRHDQASRATSIHVLFGSFVEIKNTSCIELIYCRCFLLMGACRYCWSYSGPNVVWILEAPTVITCNYGIIAQLHVHS